MAIGGAVCAMLPERMRTGAIRSRRACAGSVPSVARISIGASSARSHNRTTRSPEAQDRNAPEAPAKSRERVRAQFPAMDHAGAQTPTGAAVQYDAERVV